MKLTKVGDLEKKDIMRGLSGPLWEECSARLLRGVIEQGIFRPMVLALDRALPLAAAFIVHEDLTADL